jgi:hypothetical protein
MTAKTFMALAAARYTILKNDFFRARRGASRLWLERGQDLQPAENAQTLWLRICPLNGI